MTLHVQTALGEIFQMHSDWQHMKPVYIPGNHGAMPCVVPGSEEMPQDDERVIWVNRAFVVKVWYE